MKEPSASRSRTQDSFQKIVSENLTEYHGAPKGKIIHLLRHRLFS